MKVDGIDIELVHDNTIGITPAKIRILVPGKKAILFYSDKFQSYPKSTRRFIILHEVGHAVLNTGDEEAVDRWAYYQFIKSGGREDQAVFALSKVLDPLNVEDHEIRLWNQFYRAKHTSFLKGKISWKKFKKIKKSWVQNT